MPPQASTFVPDVDGVYYLTLWICAFFFVLITGILVYSIFKWRRVRPDQPAESNVTHNTTLEVVWTLIPLVIVMVLFAWGWKGGIDMTVAPADALQYEVKGKQWNWFIKHPGGTTESIDEMWVPINTPVKVTLYSDDVLHSFYVPAFRCKRDVLPGRYQMVWFEATRLSPPEGFPIFCAEYCGTNHSYMMGRIHVVSQEEYDTRPWDVRPTDPVELGEWGYDRLCKNCHTIDGSRMTGPTFMGLWGKDEVMEDGSTVTVDADYIIESILEPNARRVKGYEGVQMSPGLVQASDEALLNGLVEYIKTLK